MKFIIKLIVVLAIGWFAVTLYQNRNKHDTIGENVKATADTAKDAIKEAATKTGEAVKEAWDTTKEKVGSVTTNGAAEVKEKKGEKEKEAAP